MGKIKKRTTLAIIMLAASGSVFGVTSSLSGSLQDQATKLQSEYTQLVQRTEEGRTKTKIVREAQPIYEKLHLTSGKASIDPLAASAQLESWRKNYAFEIPQTGSAGSGARIDPLKDSPDGLLKRPQALAVEANITIPQILLYTDESLIQLMKQMREGFGGIIRVTRFSMTLKREELAVKIEKGDPSVAAAIEAKWFGLKLIEKPSPPGAPAGGPK